MERPCETNCTSARPVVACSRLKQSWSKMRHSTRQCNKAPAPSTARLNASLSEIPFDLQEYFEQAENKRGTVLYLAYGSNLSVETFRGKRGIKPLSQINVQVPSLRLTFDLPGIPYGEPCFANSATRDPQNDPAPRPRSASAEDEKTPLLRTSTQKEDYHKNRWYKGLIGVVYEVTPQDYAHIIETEGGGASYHDVLVDCHPFDSKDPTAPVPQDPTLPAFRAHTLFAPAPEDKKDGSDSGRFVRPDPSYAQPSARYLKLISDGAAELSLPYEYQDYLKQIRPFTITNTKQRIGQFIFLGIWVPIVFFIFGISKLFADKKGRSPAWLMAFTAAVFRAVWESYDGFFKQLFGDGERTIGQGGHDSSTYVRVADDAAEGPSRSWPTTSHRLDSDPEKAEIRHSPGTNL